MLYIDHDGDRTVSTISTADTRKRFAPSAAHNQAHEHEGLEVPTKIPFDVDDDDVDDGDTLNSQGKRSKRAYEYTAMWIIC